MKIRRGMFFFFVLFDLIVSGYKSGAQIVSGDSIVPITLQQAIDLGVANSYKVKSANLRIDIANENVKQRKTDHLPDLNIGIDGYWINDPTLYTTDFFKDPVRVDYTPYQLSGKFMVSQVIYAGNRISNSINQEELQKKIAEYLSTKTTAETKIRIINEYLNLYTLIKDYRISVQTIDQIELRLKTLRSKFINGQVVKNDVSRSELQKSDFELKLLRTVNNASATNYFLTLLLGLPQNVIIKVDTSVVYSSDTVFVFDDCLLTAFNNRPEFQAAKANKELSENTLKLVTGNKYPTINGVGLYGLQNPVPGTFPPEGKFLSYLTIGAGVNYNIASLYKVSHQKSTTELSIKIAEEDINDMRNSLSDEVKQQFINYEIDRQSLSIYVKKIQFAEDNYKIIQSRYYNDLALITDMVDAELEYNQAKLELIKGQVQTRLSYYRMLKAIGKL